MGRKQKAIDDIDEHSLLDDNYNTLSLYDFENTAYSNNIKNTLILSEYLDFMPKAKDQKADFEIN